MAELPASARPTIRYQPPPAWPVPRSPVPHRVGSSPRPTVGSFGASETPTANSSSSMNFASVISGLLAPLAPKPVEFVTAVDAPARLLNHAPNPARPPAHRHRPRRRLLLRPAPF